jgi:threonine dehydrogenase-like Zn-dependent dehydrogenase
MKAIILEKPEHFATANIDEPNQPQAGEALVEVSRVGICGTDVAGYLGKMPFYTYPVIPGHELGVTVLAMGEGVENVKVSDRCSVEPYMNCGECFACCKGATNCCESLEVIGVHKDVRAICFAGTQVAPVRKIDDGAVGFGGDVGDWVQLREPRGARRGRQGFGDWCGADWDGGD